MGTFVSVFLLALVTVVLSVLGGIVGFAIALTVDFIAYWLIRSSAAKEQRLRDDARHVRQEFEVRSKQERLNAELERLRDENKALEKKLKEPTAIQDVRAPVPPPGPPASNVLGWWLRRLWPLGRSVTK